MRARRSQDEGAPPWHVRAWPAWARGAAAVLVASSRAVPPIVAIAWALGTNAPPRLLLGALASLALLPAAAAWLLARAFAARIEPAGDDWVLHTARRRIEVPAASLAALVPWRVPLPGAGAAIALRSGARLAVGVEPLPASLRAALARSGAVVPAHFAWTAADARRTVSLGWPAHPLVKFGAFALLPIGILFRAHQVIAYGAPFGQAYLEGWAAWSATLARDAATTLLMLVLYASVWRAAAEGVALLATRVAPSRAARVRRAVELACLAVYYAGVPALLAVRLLA